MAYAKKKIKNQTLPAYLPVLACTCEGSRLGHLLFWRGFGLKQREGECCPHGLSHPALISWVQMQVFFSPSCRH